jgi:hypothetical protein
VTAKCAERARRAVLLALTLFAASPAFAEETEPDESGAWMDSSRTTVTDSANSMAEWVDSFFGLPQADEQSASSFVRVRPQYEWDEKDHSDWKLRGTGQLQLPQLSERLSLVFFGEEGDFNDEFYDPALRDGSSTLGLQYNLSEKRRSRFDLNIGIKAGPKGKVGGKYRYDLPFLTSSRLRFSEELFWIGGDGFGTLTRLDLDRRLGDSTLLRWANRAEYSEESNGVEWRSRMGWVTKLDKQSAYSAFTFIRGDTDPEWLKSYGLSLKYRRQFLRDWLFYEIEPRYAWRKGKHDTQRDGVASIQLRLEIRFGEKRRRSRHVGSSTLANR